MQTGPGDRPVRKARRTKPPAQPKSIVQAAADVAQKAEKAAEQAPKPRPAKRRPPAMLDVLPAKKGQKPRPYKPAPARQVQRKIKAENDRVKAVREAKRAVAAVAALTADKPAPKKHGGLIGTITGAADLGEKIAPKVAAVANPAGALNLVTHGAVAKTAGNVPKDAAELVLGTPASVVKLGDTAIHNPEKVPGMLAQPYKDLLKDPGKAITEHPVSTALMVTGIGKGVTRGAGAAARAVGAQSIERPAATLAGTALKEKRLGSRDLVVRAVQSRADKRNPSPAVSDKALGRRVDEFFDFSQQKRGQIRDAARKTALDQAKQQGLDRAARRAQVKANVRGAGKGSRRTIDQRFVKEFGSTWQVHQSGAIVKPKNAAAGFLHDSRETADRVAAALAADPKIAWEPRVMKAGNKYGVVPKVALDRLRHHRRVGTSRSTGSKILRESRHALTQAVLPTSPRWLMGQATEAGVRAAVSRSGPMDLLRVNRVVKKMNAANPGSGDEMLMRISGGQLGLTGTAREFAEGRKSLADTFAGTGLATPAKAATRVGESAAGKGVRAGWNKYSRAVMDSINGAFENTSRRAMAGQAMKEQGLFDKKILTLSDKAISDAAKGLRGTDAQVALGRAVDRMYGQYQKFSPGRREALMHWSPFLPWYLNAAKFLGSVLPNDHPVATSLLVSADRAMEDWRKSHGLSLYGPHKPLWQLGTYPAKAGLVNIAKYTPFGVGVDPAANAADLVLPQIVGPIKNLAGVDWKWQPLKHPGYNGKPFNFGEKSLRAVLSALESQVPVVGPAAQLTGLENKVDRKKVGAHRRTVGEFANPLSPIPNTKDEPVAKGKGRLPPGVSASEVKQIAREAAQQGVSVSPAEIRQLLREQRKP